LKPKFSSSQFHPHFTSTFCDDISSAKILQSLTVNREKLHTILLYEKASRKILVKLTPGLVKIKVLTRQSTSGRYWFETRFGNGLDLVMYKYC
jgi:hypothetical protein